MEEGLTWLIVFRGCESWSVSLNTIITPDDMVLLALETDESFTADLSPTAVIEIFH